MTQLIIAVLTATGLHAVPTEITRVSTATMESVGHHAPLEQSLRSTEPELNIDIHYQPGEHCVVPSTAPVVQRNLTLPYHQQTLYGTAQCQQGD